jgi:hypothetical protein
LESIVYEFGLRNLEELKEFLQSRIEECEAESESQTGKRKWKLEGELAAYSLALQAVESLPKSES